MGVPTVAESQLQRPSGSGVARATGYRTQVRPAKTARDTPPLYLVLPLAAKLTKLASGLVNRRAAAARWSDSCTNSRRGCRTSARASQPSQLCSSCGAAGPTLSLQQESISGSKRSEAACATKPEPS